MNIGVIGTGNIGAVIVKKLRDAGYPVKMATSKGPASLRELAAKTGAIPVSVEENGTKAYRAVENADHQTQANAFRSLFNEKNETVRKNYAKIRWQKLSDFMNSVVQKYFASKRLHSRIPPSGLVAYRL